MDMLIIHAAATWVMLGVICLVQLVHYPSFLFVSKDRFLEFERFHQFRISLIVGPAMLLEAGTGAILLSQPEYRGNPLFLLSMAFLVLIWLSTVLLQGPLHDRLAKSHDETVIRRLIRWNWLRTVSWGLRALLVLSLLRPA